MTCTGLSVVRGTAISSFNVEIIDVIAAESGLSGPRLLVRVSGPAVDATGVGPGFSGSPILCDGRNAGAISEAIGEYGNHVVLATPIEEMLREQPRAPIAARRDPALLRAARPLAAPLTVSGLSGRGLRLFERAAQAGRRLRARGPGRAAGRLRAGAARAGRGRGRLDLDGRPRDRRGRHGELSRRRPHLGLRPRARRPRTALAVPHRRVRLQRHPEPARHRRRRDHVQARLVGRPRAGLDHERRIRRDRRQRRRAARVDPAAGDGARPAPAGGSRSTPSSPTSARSVSAPASRSWPRSGSRQAVDTVLGCGWADAALGVRSLPRARAAPADRLLQPVLRDRRRAARPHRRQPSSSSPTT